MPALVAARALQGLGGGGLMTLSMLAVVASFPPAERGRRMGGLGAAYSLATLLGPLAGGLLLQIAPWQAAFWLNVPLAALAWGVPCSALLNTAPVAMPQRAPASPAYDAAAHRPGLLPTNPSHR